VSILVQFRPASKTQCAGCPGSGIEGLYFNMPAWHQAQRRREMAKARFPPELIRDLCRAWL
jgi:hypothetical protein